ncbi:MAG TPA: class I SAM-dependent methyltransferase [Phycisphaerae bacterium]|nr:class I SAM-dependent methyltransferase [Phycisphaerae bacterium]HRY66906.1 class I SAM-dependent methyltransferase [Phycisphaerae bacterium]HSA27854.1 class I SAM-dependent methyltransferase [Phycisphaerae bacterium]
MNHGDVGRIWDENAAAWTRLTRMGCDVLRDYVNTPAFLEMLPEVAGLRGLDIGCGEGHNTRLVAGKGARMTAFDISRIFVQQAHAYERDLPLYISYLRASAVELPFAAEAFDFAMATMSLMDMPEHERVMGEVHRVLKPGGFLQFSISHPCFATPRWKWILDEEGNRIAMECGDYFQELHGEMEHWIFSNTPAELKDELPEFHIPRFTRTLSAWMNLLLDAGFAIERLDEPCASDEALARQPTLADSRVIAYTLIVRCRKA